MVLLLVGGLVVAWVMPSSNPVSVPRPEGLEGADPAVKRLIAASIEKLESDLENAASWANLAKTYDANEMLELAARCYARALSLDDSHSRWWYRLALLEARAGKLDDAVQSMRRSIDRNHDYAPSHWRLGLWLLDDGEPASALIAFEQATITDPTDIAGWWGIARAYLMQQKPGEAARALEPLLESHPSLTYTHYLLGLAYTQMGRREDAAMHLALGVDARPVWYDPWESEIEKYQVGFAARLKRAYHLSQSGRVHEAISIEEGLQQERPEHIALLNNLGMDYFRVGRIDDGLRVFEHALAVDPDYAGTHLNLAVAYQRTGDNSAALAHVEHALLLAPNLPRAYEIRGIVHMNSGNFAPALSAFEQALALGGRNAMIPVWMGLLHCDLNHCQLGAEILEQAAREHASLPGVFFALARAHIHLGNFEKARDALESAKTLAPEESQLLQLEQRLGLAEIKTSKGSKGERGV